METTITLLARKKPGVLTRVAAALGRKGYSPQGQTMADASPELSRITLKLMGPEAAAEELAMEVRGVHDVVEVEGVDVETFLAAEASAQDAQIEELLQDNLRQIVAAYPKIVPLVRSFERRLGPAAGSSALFEIGHRVGVREYRKNYSLGSPLQLSASLKRIVVPALRGFAKAESGDAEIRVKACPFCGDRKTPTPNCHFVSGFIQGFLDSAPTTQGLSVLQSQGLSAGDPQCTFVVNGAPS